MTEIDYGDQVHRYDDDQVMEVFDFRGRKRSREAVCLYVPETGFSRGIDVRVRVPVSDLVRVEVIEPGGDAQGE